jgi:DNA-binding IclR family transcriptional regulator
MMASTPRTPVGKRTAASRVLALLGAFSRGGGSLTLSEISRHADLSLTTTHRLAKEVLEWGGLELDCDGRYRLGRKILDLASASTEALELREKVLPLLVDLHSATGLTVHLAARDGTDVVYLEALRSHPNYTGENRIGGRLRLHVTATGLVLLAYANPEVVDEYLRDPLKVYTPHTIGDEQSLRENLKIVRRQGFAIAHQFMTLGAGSVSAPIVNAEGVVDAAVGVVYLVGVHDPTRLIDHVRAAANRMSRALSDRRVVLDPRTIDFNRRNAGLL